ncbi:MAG: DISARM system SNF2-like helicase DrmD [Phycisphaerales bacterium]
MATLAPPNPGQLVQVRQRRFVVARVLRSEVAGTGDQQSNAAQHLVALKSVDDESGTDDLEVVWELELDAHAFEGGTLPAPTGFDDPRRMDAFIDAVRWAAVSAADIRTLQSPFRSGIEIEDYQLDPVVRALQMPRVNLLVADDVGLGKTIEAGLVTFEMLLRHRARTVLIVCPASIQVQWQEQMRDKFGLEFRIIDSEAMRHLRRSRGLHVNPWAHFPRLITSIDFIKRERPMRLFRDTLPAGGEAVFPRRYDLLILDEAHNVAPAATGNYALDSQRTACIRTLVQHFEHKLFLTATPHNGYQESFTALLQLLDNQRFAVGLPPTKDQLGAVMVRRMKSELAEREDGSRRFADPDVVALPVAYTVAERRAHAALQEYSRARQKNAGSPGERFACEFVLKLLKKRMFSSPAAFQSTLERHTQSLAAAGAVVTGKAALRAIQRQLDEVDDDAADDDAIEETIGDAIEDASGLFPKPGKPEQLLLKELRDFANDAVGRPDCKAKALIQWLKEHIKPAGVWGRERVIIFTEYRATHKWLKGLFAAEGLNEKDRLLELYGGMDPKDREKIKAAFQASPDDSPVRILLATDAAAEGINLQNHCCRLIHYEIPWNPNRMEQRNGRVHRHGQKAPVVHLYHFVGSAFDKNKDLQGVPAGDLEGDLEFLMRAAIKVNAIREDLGKVGPVIAQQVEEAMLGKRTRLDTQAAEKQNEPVRQMLRLERKVREQIARLREQLQESRIDLRISPDNIRAVVDVGLELARQPALKSVLLHGTPHTAYQVPPLSGTWSICAEGLTHPHTHRVRPITFDHAVAAGRDDVVLVHLNHRLVQMCLRLLRAEMWTLQTSTGLHRVTARIVPTEALGSIVAVAHGRLVVIGGDGHRLNEEVIEAAGAIDGSRFTRLNVGETKAALAAATHEVALEAVRAALSAQWSQHSSALQSTLEARMRERTRNVESFLQERADREAADIAAILGQLERGIRAQLDKPLDEQLTLWTVSEQDQYKRNLASLRERLAQIPDEIARETAAVRARYANPAPRVFPIGVTYLVPRRIADDMARRDTIRREANAAVDAAPAGSGSRGARA